MLPLAETALYYCVVKQWVALTPYVAMAVAMAFYYFPVIGLFSVRREMSNKTSRQKFAYLFSNLFYCLILLFSVVYLNYSSAAAAQVACVIIVVANFLITIIFFKNIKDLVAFYNQIGFFVLTSVMAIA